MAEKIGAPERGVAPADDEAASPDDDDRPASPDRSDPVATNGASPATAAVPVIDDEPLADEPPLDGSPADGARPDGDVDATDAATVGPSDERTAAASRHPSMAQRLGLRPRGQLRARKVQRILRRVDPWSVLKLSLVFYFCVWVMVIVAAVLLWGVAVGSGTVGSLESFIAEFLAFEEFRFNGDQLFQVFALGGLIGVFVATAVTAIFAVLFNLIADLTGGVRLTVVEEESARRLVNRR